MTIWTPPTDYATGEPVRDQGDRVQDLRRSLDMCHDYDRLRVNLDGKRYGVRITGRLTAPFPVDVELKLFEVED